jgi:ribA/ribD-fused uncharacterized protein
MFELVEKAAPLTSLICDFRDAYAFLSNFFRCGLLWQGIYYPSTEHAFQAGKALDMNIRQKIADAPTPSDAKNLGWKLTPQPHWRDRIRHDVMAEILSAKFATPSLAEQLVATGTALLVEGNTWHDNDWGWCRCRRHAQRPGHNLLGHALMRRRAELNPAIANRWVRVAATGHRPHKIPRKQRDWVRDKLAYVAEKAVREHGMEVAISGLAMGSDLWWADAAHAVGARVWGHSPHPQQDQRWPDAWKDHRRRVMELAERVEHLGPEFSNAYLFGRNTWMINEADALVVVADTSRSTGGTIAALHEARTRIPVVLIDLYDETVRLVKPQETRLLGYTAR